MLTLLPPAKTFDTSLHKEAILSTIPYFKEEAFQLAKKLGRKSASSIEKLMKVSPSIALLTKERFLQFEKEFGNAFGKQALYLYNGETIKQLSRDSYTLRELKYIQKNIRFISGLYGLVSPFDTIQPYRLEMKIKVSGSDYKNLYEFWENKIAQRINKLCAETGAQSIFNATSQEYAKVINPEKINVPVISVVFKERRGYAYKVIGTISKKARGSIVDFIVKNHITNIETVKEFTGMHYQFSVEDSTDVLYVFREV